MDGRNKCHLDIVQIPVYKLSHAKKTITRQEFCFLFFFCFLESLQRKMCAIRNISLNLKTPELPKLICFIYSVSIRLI
jgi:hypothetical protein